jgi:hypothetical protein
MICDDLPTKIVMVISNNHIYVKIPANNHTTINLLNHESCSLYWSASRYYQ